MPDVIGEMAETGSEGECVRYGVGGEISARKTGSVGDGEREPGRGIWEGVGGSMGSSVDTVGLFLDVRFDATLESVFVFARVVAFTFIGDEAYDSAGVSTTQGKPECGPLRFLIDEKCSQS